MTTPTDSRIRYQQDLLLILLRLQILLVSLGMLNNIARLIWEPPLRGMVQIAIQILVILGSWGAIRLIKDGKIMVAANIYMVLVTLLAALNIVTSPVTLLLIGVMLMALAGIFAGFLQPLVKVWQWGIFNTSTYLACLMLRGQIRDLALDLEQSQRTALYLFPALMIIIYTYLGQRIGQFIASTFESQRIIAKKNAELYNTSLQEIAERILIETRLKEREQSAQELQDHLKTLHQMTFELSDHESLDDIYRRGVEYGLNKFGLDRLALFRLDAAKEVMLATYGTDPQGDLRAEHGYTMGIREGSPPHFDEVLKHKDRVMIVENIRLIDTDEPIGTGWHARAVLLDGKEPIGILVVDNLIHQRPPRPYEQELLSTFASALAHAISRKEAELAIRHKEQSSREFQDHLKKLHQLTLELAALETVDDIYKRGVIYGLNDLGLDRIGIARFDDTKTVVIGTYGTDPEGNLRSEHDFQASIIDNAPPFYKDALSSNDHVLIVDNVELHDYGQVVGTGWHASAVLMDGTDKVGIILADNLIHQRPPRPYEQELLSTFASTLAHAVSRKESDIAIRHREQSSREFQRHLERLHQLTLELAALETPDDIFKRGVEYGLTELNVDRIALFRLDKSKDIIVGTYGTDSEGNLRPEHDFAAGIHDGSPSYSDLLAADDLVKIVESSLLHDEKQVVGKGWHARAVLLDGATRIGMLVADNLIHQRPPRPYEQELLSTFASTLAHAISRKQSELSLRHREQSSREFQDHLKKLHQLTLELATLNTLDEIYKRGVEYGLNELDLDRMAILRLDDTKEFVIGTYGTDPEGNLRDEHYFTAAVRDDSPPHFDDVLAQNDRVMIADNIELRDNKGVVGIGWHACAVFLDGKDPIGMLVADNLIQQRPPRPYERELLSTFASMLAHAISRKEAELSLRQREQSSHELKEHLKTLHRMTVELSELDELDAIYRRGVEFGLTEFGFDRLGLTRLDESKQMSLGTYGTDLEGKLRDEHDFSVLVSDRVRIHWDELVKKKNQAALWEDVDLLDYNQAVGKGWNVMAALWDGNAVLGILSVDNLINHHPPRPYELELISLFSGTLAHLIRTQEAKNILRQNEQSARDFQDHLKTLHRMTVELSELDKLEAIYRRGVEYGLAEFGFDRLGLFRLDKSGQTMLGTFGTDPDGNIRDEREFTSSIGDGPRPFWEDIVKSKDQVAIWENVDLIDYDQAVGTGWNAMAALWDGTTIIGIVAIDNFVNHRPPRPYEQELISLYSGTLAHLIRTEEAKNTLRHNEQSAREFQDHLKALHRMTIELAQLETVDEVFRSSVAYGLNEFGIDRLGLFLIDHDTDELVGMFGTAPDGSIRDERRFRTSISGRAQRFFEEVVEDKDQVAIWEDAELVDYDEVVGIGWNGMAALWSGNQIIGAVAFDNFVTQRPLRPYEHDLMRLYSSVLSHLVTRKRAEQSRIDYAMERERVNVLQQFLAAASHDLRTPLSVVQMNAYLLRSVDDDQQRDHYLDIVDNQVERLKRLLEDMLAMSRLDVSSDFEYEWVDLVNLTHTITDQQGALAARKNHHIEFEPKSTLPLVYADRVQLGQAVRNILLNALHYSPSGGTVKVSVYQEMENVVIAVQDSGIGISDEHLPHIFERFYRSDAARSTETGGSGLGLSIAKKIIEGHQGRITVESKVGVGSTFKFIMPLPVAVHKE